jgi:hypothetical protein
MDWGEQRRGINFIAIAGCLEIFDPILSPKVRFPSP